MAMDVPIPEDVVEHAQERNEERSGGVLEDYIVECIDVSVTPENAPE